MREKIYKNFWFHQEVAALSNNAERHLDSLKFNFNKCIQRCEVSFHIHYTKRSTCFNAIKYEYQNQPLTWKTFIQG